MVQYITNESGKKPGIQLTLKQWERLQKDIKKLELFEELKQAFKEMGQHQKGNLKTLTTKQLHTQL